MKKILISMMLILCMLTATASASVLIVSNTNTYDDSAAMYYNLDRAIAMLNGRVIEKGKPFSFNETVGPRTAVNGFVSAPNSNGYNVMGGGVSQIATTLHLAVKNLGSEVTFQEMYSFGSSFKADYVATALESVMTDYARGLDYIFTSNHAENLFISMWRADGMVFCQLTGIGNETAVPDATPAPDENVAENSGEKLYKVVNVQSYVNLRESPSTSANAMIQIPKDAVVKYADETNGKFLKVVYQGVTGYAHGDYLEEVKDADAQPELLKVVNCKQSVTLRAKPSKSAEALADVPLGSVVEAAGEKTEEFTKVVFEGKTGYILNAYLK